MNERDQSHMIAYPFRLSEDYISVKARVRCMCTARHGTFSTSKSYSEKSRQEFYIPLREGK